MTIAIGLPFQHFGKRCCLICADSKAVAIDGSTLFGAKIRMGALSGSKRMASIIAGATDDMEASEMLAEDIIFALHHNEQKKRTEAIVKATMTEWYSAYGANKPPNIQFLVGVGLEKTTSLYYCSPPNTVVEKREAFAIGSGARALDPLLPRNQPLPSLGAAVGRIAYWMYRAKTYEGTYCGGRTYGYVIAKGGAHGILDSKKLDKLESEGERIDNLINNCVLTMTSGAENDVQNDFLKSLRSIYMEIADRIAGIGIGDISPSASQTSEPGT